MSPRGNNGLLYRRITLSSSNIHAKKVMLGKAVRHFPGKVICGLADLEIASIKEIVTAIVEELPHLSGLAQ